MKPEWKLSPYLYILPALIILVAFRLIPIVMSFIISFYDWSIQGTGRFIGLENYATLLKDPVFWQSMLNTFWLVIIQVPATIVFSLLFAVLLNRIKLFKSFFRIIYFDLDAVFGEFSRSGKKAAKDKFISSFIAEYIDSLQKAEEKIE
mgnify:CR=1 FL=1